MQIRIDYENHTTPFLLLPFPKHQLPFFLYFKKKKENSLQWDTHLVYFVNGKTHNNNGTQLT